MKRIIILFKEFGNFNSDVQYIDNSTASGKRKVERLLMDDYEIVGVLETNLRNANVVKCKIQRPMRDRVDKLTSTLREIINVAEKGM